MEMQGGVQENIVEREVRAIKEMKKKKGESGRKSSNTKNKENQKTVSQNQPKKKTKKEKKTLTKNDKPFQNKKKNQGKQQPEQQENQKDTKVPTGPYGRQISAWESCDVNTVNDTCLQNALDSLEFEKNQIQNFYKQQSRAKNHNKTIGGKLGKKDEFSAAAVLMLDALGGNISNPSCNSNSTSAAALAAIANYNLLNNCSASVEEACTMPTETYNATITAQLDACATIFDTSKSIADDCRSLKMNTVNGTNACICWANAAIGIKVAKKAGCKASSTAKSVKTQKTKCLVAFGDCKKAEDSAVALIHACMTGDIKSLEEAAKDSVNGRLEGDLNDYVYFSTEYPDSPLY